MSKYMAFVMITEQQYYNVHIDNIINIVKTNELAAGMS